MGGTRHTIVMDPIVVTGNAHADFPARDTGTTGMNAGIREPPETSDSLIRITYYRGQPVIFEYLQYEFGFWGAKLDKPRRRWPTLAFPQKVKTRDYYVVGDVLCPNTVTEQKLRQMWPGVFGSEEQEHEEQDLGQIAFRLLLGLNPPTFNTALKIRDIHPHGDGTGRIEWDLLIQLDADENSALTISPACTDNWQAARIRWAWIRFGKTTAWIEPAGKFVIEVCMWAISGLGHAGKTVVTRAARRAVLKLAGRHFVRKAVKIAGSYPVALVLAFSKSFLAQRETDEFLMQNQNKFLEPEKIRANERLVGAILVAFADAVEVVVIQFIQKEIKLPSDTSQELAKLVREKLIVVARQEVAKLFVGQIISLYRAVGQQARLNQMGREAQKLAWQNEMLKSSKLKDAGLALLRIVTDEMQKSLDASL